MPNFCLAVAMGDRGCMSLFGQDTKQHRLFAEHITSEYRVKTEGHEFPADIIVFMPTR